MSGAVATLMWYRLAMERVQRVQKTFELEVFRTEKLLLYPIVLFLTFTPAILDDLIVLFVDHTNLIGITATRMLITNLLGFFNALVYGSEWRVYRSSLIKKAQLSKASVGGITRESIQEMSCTIIYYD